MRHEGLLECPLGVGSEGGDEGDEGVVGEAGDEGCGVGELEEQLEGLVGGPGVVLGHVDCTLLVLSPMMLMEY